MVGSSIFLTSATSESSCENQDRGLNILRKLLQENGKERGGWRAVVKSRGRSESGRMLDPNFVIWLLTSVLCVLCELL